MTYLQFSASDVWFIPLLQAFVQDSVYCIVLVRYKTLSSTLQTFEPQMKVFNPIYGGSILTSHLERTGSPGEGVLLPSLDVFEAQI